MFFKMNLNLSTVVNLAYGQSFYEAIHFYFKYTYLLLCGGLQLLHVLQC